MPRSFLFVPADSERKLERAAGVPADALILDLEDAVAVAERPKARALAAEFLADRDCVWVRINPMGTEAAVHVPAFDTVFTDFRDAEGLASYARHARRDGFAGMLAIHPAQVAIINEAFTPTPAEIEEAREIVRLFAERPQAGVLALDGRMIDRPHLAQAERLLLQTES